MAPVHPTGTMEPMSNTERGNTRGPGPTREAVHPVRGFVVALFFALPMFVSAVVAFFALADAFMSGLLPSGWFSDNPSDWLFGVGTRGSGRSYVVFMVSAMVAFLCYRVIWWGYNGREK